MEKASCEACCGEHSCYRGSFGGMWYHVLRWALLVIILLITFLFGVKMGELKSGMWDYGYGRGGGYRMMDDYYYKQMPYGSPMKGAPAYPYFQNPTE